MGLSLAMLEVDERLLTCWMMVRRGGSAFLLKGMWFLVAKKKNCEKQGNGDTLYCYLGNFRGREGGKGAN